VLGSSFAEVAAGYIDLTDSERAALARLEERRRVLRRGTTIQRENEAAGGLHVLRRGLMMSYVLLQDGSRQILRFMFPGDLIGTAAMVYDEATETTVALSEVVVCSIDRSALGAMFEEHPRLAALVFALSQVERVALTDRLAALGRTSAKARVGALLLEFRDRLNVERPVFLLGLTQEEIADATGLTAVHVNRMLRQLEEEALIERANGRVAILDERALARISNYVRRDARLNLDWLPKPR